MDAAEVELFERSLRQAAERASGGSLDTALDEIGWAEAFEADPRVAVSTLFELQGAANATSAALDRVVGQALGGVEGVVLPRLGSGTPPGEADDRLAVDGLGTRALARLEGVTVVTMSSGRFRAADVMAADLSLQQVGGIDPSLGLVRVTGDVLSSGGRALDDDEWDAAIAAGRRALGHELVGASRTMLQLARDHAVDRIQFGVPIASFQAVRHRLAESLVAIEAGAAALDAAWLDPGPTTAAAAKAVAGRSARTVARHCQQVLAGIGFTAEHPFHHHLRRILVLDALLGDARSLAAEQGAALLRDRRLPVLLPL